MTILMLEGPLVSKSIDVHLPRPVGSLWVLFDGGREEVAIVPKQAMAVPPCWWSGRRSWVLWAVEETKGVWGS